MSFGLLLLPAVGGYWFLTTWNYTRYQVERDSGYRLLFRSAIVGIFFYCVAKALTLALDLICPFLTLLWDAHFPDPFTSEVILSLGLSVVIPPVLNWRYTKLQGARRVARNAGDHVELLIDRAIEERKAIELSLRSRRIYIGVATESGISATSDTDVVMIPMLSGYRQEGTLELVVTTNYVNVILNNAVAGSGRTVRDLQVVIPLSEVVSARLFDLQVYQAFRANGYPPATAAASPAPPGTLGAG